MKTEKMAPILTIIIPSYNTARYINKVIPSFISDELMGRIKVLFVNDGSTDDTQEKINYYTERYPELFECFTKPNGGHGSVINEGVRLTTTKYFKIVDGDDWVKTDALIELTDYLSACDDDMVLTDCLYVYPDKTQLSTGVIGTDLKPRISYDRSKLNDASTSIHKVTFKTEMYRSAGILLPEKTYYEDNLYHLYPLRSVRRFSYIDIPVYQYRLGNEDQSVSLRSHIKHLEQGLSITYRLIDFCLSLKEEENLAFGKLAGRVTTANVCSCLYTIPFTDATNKQKRQLMLDLNNKYRKTIYHKEAKKRKGYMLMRLTAFRCMKLYQKLFIRRR